jgi:hypothetical protein
MHALVTLLAIAFAASCTPSTTSELRVAGSTDQQNWPRDDAARMCLGVPGELQSTCPLERGHVVAVKAVRESVSPKGRDFLVGATIYVVASPGLTAEWLGHRIGCYKARLAEAAPAEPAVCPLDRSAKVRVDGTTNGFAVTVKSDDLEIARSILRASEAFAN